MPIKRQTNPMYLPSLIPSIHSTLYLRLTTVCAQLEWLTVRFSKALHSIR